MYSPLGRGVFFPLKTVLGSFLMLNEPSIGYVWIMRIFLLIALVMPLLQRISQKLSFMWFTVLIYSMVLIQSVLINVIGGIEIHKLHLVVDQTVLYVFAYSIFALIGINIPKFKRGQVLGLAMLSVLSLVVYFGYKGGFVEPRFYKYPPSQIYLLYGMMASFLLWYVQPWISRKLVESKVCRYLSENSMWIYLWHIIPVYYITDKMTSVGWLPWMVRFSIVLVIALLLNWLWHKIIVYLPKSINKYLS